MKHVFSVLKAAFAVCGAVTGRFFGGLDGCMIALIAFVCADYVTGVLAAAINRELSSAVGFRGLLKKTAVFLLVGLANVVDLHVLSAPGVLRMAVIFYYISNEGISILENYTRMGLPVPDQLRRVLIQLQESAEEEEFCAQRRPESGFHAGESAPDGRIPCAAASDAVMSDPEAPDAAAPDTASVSADEEKEVSHEPCDNRT